MKKLVILFAGVLIFQGHLWAQDPAATEDWSKKPPKVESKRNGCPPSDAIVLFKKSGDLKNWVGRNGDAAWKTMCNKMTVNGTGDIRTREAFGDCQLHVEFRTPKGENDLEGQGKGNSGVYIQQRYEVQVLDSYENETYYNGQAGSVYKQSPPLVNSSRKPGKWQSYDIIFKAPVFADDGSLVKPAFITVLHNGVLIQDNFEIQGASVYAGTPSYQPHGEAPLLLQDHGNKVQYRNIWIRKLNSSR